MSASWLLFSTPYSKLNHQIYYSINFKQMVTTSSSSPNRGAFTTLKERVIFEKEIKKGKLTAIAGHIPDERSAQSFLSEVRDPRATHYCWAYKVPMGLEVPFELLGVLYHQLRSFQAEDIKQDFDTGKDGVAMITSK